MLVVELMPHCHVKVQCCCREQHQITWCFISAMKIQFIATMRLTGTGTWSLNNIAKTSFVDLSQCKHYRSEKKLGMQLFCLSIIYIYIMS
jgi:hypothetical protein